MTTVEPIRDAEKVVEIQERLRKAADTDAGRRRYLLFICGVYLGLRISDLLRLRVSDLRGKTLVMREKKTRKRTELPIAETLRRAARDLLGGSADEDYVFRSARRGPNGEIRPISRRMAYNDIKTIARAAGLTYPIGCHTLRKTFGYHQYQIDHDVAFLMDWYNHSSPEITLRYIGINQDSRKKKIDRLERYFRERARK